MHVIVNCKYGKERMKNSLEKWHHCFYTPNFEKVGSILLSACPCVCVCVCAFVRPFKKIEAMVLKFHVWIPRQKISYP